LGLGFWLNFEFRLVTVHDFFFTAWIRELGLKRCGSLLAGLVGLLFAPLSAVAHPSPHAALVTRWAGK
jgi:hypothetical protein